MTQLYEGRAIFGYSDWGDAATLTVAGGNELDTAPVTNLQTEQPRDLWVSTSTSAVLTFDRGETKPLDLISLWFTNLTSSATWTLTASDVSASGTDLLNASGLNFWNGESLAAYRRIHGMHFLTTGISPRWVQITLSDAGNPDGFLSAGRAILADSNRPSLNANYGSVPFGFRNFDERIETPDGATIRGDHVVDNAPFSSLEFEFVGRSEVYGMLHPFLALRAGKSMFVVFDPTATDGYRYHGMIYGLLQQVVPVPTPVYNRHVVRFDIEGLT